MKDYDPPGLRLTWNHKGEWGITDDCEEYGSSWTDQYSPYWEADLLAVEEHAKEQLRRVEAFRRGDQR